MSEPRFHSSLLPLLALGLSLGTAACHGSKGGEKASLPPAGQAAPAPEGQHAAAPAGEAGKSGDAASGQPTAGQADAGKEAANGASGERAPAEAGAAVGTPSPAAAKPAESTAYRLTGAVSAVRRSQIGFRVGGVIQTVTAKPGNVFKKGETLASLDDRDFILRVELAKAKLEGAKTAQENADKEFKREQQLQKENASTASNIDRMRLNFEQAHVNVKLAELDLRAAEDALKDSKLVAPYDCVVAQQFKYDGEQVATTPPTSVFEVYDVSAPEVDFAAPERLMGQVQVGSKLNVTVPSAAYSGTAQVIRMVPVVNDKTRSFTVTVRLATDKKIAPGAYAEATLD